MNVIYKYPIEVKDLQEIEMPQGSRILAVQCQKQKGGELGPVVAEGVPNPCLWAMINTDEGKIIRRLFRIYGTGRKVEERPEDLDYIGTFQQGPFFWHIFERKVAK